jgi:hypothetical protein
MFTHFLLWHISAVYLPSGRWQLPAVKKIVDFQNRPIFLPADFVHRLIDLCRLRGIAQNGCVWHEKALLASIIKHNSGQKHSFGRNAA